MSGEKMDNIRKTGNTLAVKIILGLIIIGFVLSSIMYLSFSGNRGPRKNEIEINGKVFNAVELADISQVTQMNPQIFFQQIIFSAAYQKLGGFTPTDDQIANEVTNTRQFMKNGVYENNQYLDTLKSAGVTPTKYVELGVIPNIESKIFSNGIFNTEFNLPSDGNVLSDLINQERTVKIATLKMSDVILSKDITVTDEQIKNYYDSHLADFKNSEKYKIDFIEISKADSDKKISRSSISDADAKKYYDENIEKFTKPAEFKYNVMSLKDKETADDVIKKLDAGENFTQLAKKYSLNPKEIETDWFTQEFVDSSLPDYASLTIKDSYKLVDNNNSFQILQLAASKDKKTLSFKEEEKSIVDQLLEQKRVDAYNQQLDALNKANPEAYISLDIFNKDAKLNQTIHHSKWNTDKETIFNNPEIQQSLASGTLYNQQGSTKKISPLIYTNNGDNVYIIQVTDYNPEFTTPLSEVNKKIKADLTTQFMTAQFSTKVNALTRELNSGKTDLLIRFNKSYHLTRTSKDLSSAVVYAAFNLIQNSDGSSAYGKVMDTADTATFIQLVSVKENKANASELQEMQNYFSQLIQITLRYAVYNYVFPNQQ